MKWVRALDKHDRLKYACEITENIENEKISSRWRGTGWVRNTIVTYALKPTEAGTEMTYAVDYKMPWEFSASSSTNCSLREVLKSWSGES
ncbi:MAG: hypothetical protein OEY88_00220 [Candidatus Bathyarchaeota archaeon]|nr:hypothetical protein [Candidatus Bathyarchaeota archaeon]